jgi:multimeric flavodoxin WrbA
MKILGFIGSPRKGENTDVLVNHILDKMKECGAETRLYNICDMDIGGCISCLACKDNPMTCSIEDDMLPLYEEIAEADGLVIGSPVYVAWITAQTKAFVDRLYAFLGSDYKPYLKEPKRCLLVMPQGHLDADRYGYIGTQLGFLLKFMCNFETKSLVAAGVGQRGARGADVRQHQDIMDAAAKLAQEMVTAPTWEGVSTPTG